MGKQPENVIQVIGKMTNPSFLLYGLLFFALGTGIARYSGTSVNWNTYLWGQLWITTLQLGANLINYFFEADRNYAPPGSRNKSIFNIPGIPDGQIAFYGGVVCLCALLPVTIWLTFTGKTGISSGMVMLALFLLAFAYAVPPIRLAESGYGEIGLSIGLVFLIPLFSFLLQLDQRPRLILLTTFPLLLANLSMQLTYELRQFASDLRYGKNNLMVRIGWQNGIMVLILSTIFSLILIAVGYFLGLPKFVLLTGLVLLPAGLTLVWLVVRIASGLKPNWRVLTFTASAYFLLMSYLMTFGYWTN